MVDIDHIVHVIYVRFMFCTYTYFHHFANIVMKFWRNISYKVCTLHVCNVGDYPCPKYEFINFNIVMLPFVLFHDVTYHTNFLLWHIHINIIISFIIMCTLVAIKSSIIEVKVREPQFWHKTWMGRLEEIEPFHGPNSQRGWDWAHPSVFFA